MDAWEWGRSLRGTRHDGLQSIADPVPGLLAVLQMAREHAKKAGTRAAGSGGSA
jgi:hypothetical protein